MNVLFLDQFSELGGAQRVLLETVEAVLARGWTAHAALPGEGPLVEHLRAKNVGVTSIPCGPYQSGNKSGGDLLRFATDLVHQSRAIADLARRNAFSLVYVNGPRLLPAAALSVRGRALFHSHSGIPRGYSSRLARWSVRRMGATVVGCSGSVAGAFRDSAAPEGLHVIPNGVRDIGLRSRDFPPANWRIGVVARISPEKGQAEFLRAARLLHGRFAPARFVVCGAPMFGAAEYRKTVEDLARDLPVEFRGWSEDLDSVFAGLDLLVVPSLEEGMGRVIVEAFSAGLPVVAFPTGGIVEVIADGETGFLTRDRSPGALAERLAEVMIGDPANLRRIAAQARRAWELSYRLDLYQARITALIESAAARPSALETGALPPRR